MIRSAFENQLHALNTNLILMGSLCEEIISKSLMLISENDQHLVNDVGKTYQKIEQMERDIESQCLKLLLRQQPVAKDLRRISADLKMVYDMKRIGAQSVLKLWILLVMVMFMKELSFVISSKWSNTLSIW